MLGRTIALKASTLEYNLIRLYLPAGTTCLL
jgi:hypothetical protein